MHRFYLAPEFWQGEALALTGTEVYHARTVLRLKPGAQIAVFDGRGREITAEITTLNSSRVELRILCELQTSAPLGRVSLAQAIPKKSQMDWIIQKAVELAAAEIVPLISERTVIALRSPEAAAAKQQKWEQVAIAAAKQCGQNWVPLIRCPVPFVEYLHGATSFDLRLIGSLQSDALPLKKVLSEYDEHHRLPLTAQLCIGPEGDFTAAELALAQNRGYVPVSFGPLTLRVETAAIYGLTVLAYELSS